MNGIEQDLMTKLVADVRSMSVKLQLLTEQFRVTNSQLQELRNNVVLLENAHLNLANDHLLLKELLNERSTPTY